MKSKIEKFISNKIEQGLYPGGQVLVAYEGNVISELSFGSKVKDSNMEDDKVDKNTLFNIESITKVMVTLPLVFKLIEDGKFHLDDKITHYIPEFGTNQEKEKVTIRDLLNFTGGIPLEDPPGCEEAASEGDIEKAWNLHYTQELACQPGSKVFYSDVSCRILGKLLERIIEKPLSSAAEEWIFKPLGMKNTTFNPERKLNCAATGKSDKGRILRGEITQDLEHYLGEVLGSDGLFSTASDMFVFSQMILNNGIYDNARILGEVTVKRMAEGITNSGLYEIPSSYLHYILSGPKTWFWEYAFSDYSFFGDLVSKKAIGKMGGAGTFLFIDPEYDLVIVYLTNYGQPEHTLEGEEGWNKFLQDIDIMGLCNIVLGDIVK
ncbi:MAG: serine hydrolase [Atribacterota bacterium]|nr:serine hydrolase [Atribacterota bacterium]MDD3031812.1 serine hydrolase [Atribacterota bacterium]MDD4289189.1 serine hydrolase [Atribacterota bacterium]MDD4765505.1 serine hydrolase [Atribacterota bacterium]MDD5635180.1 serine hydrolase [Atribacterota bacterium]